MAENSHKLLAEPETEIKLSLSLLPVPVLLVQCSHSVSSVNLTGSIKFRDSRLVAGLEWGRSLKANR